MDEKITPSFTDRFRRVDQLYTKLTYRISLISPAFLIIIMFVAVIDTLCTKLFSFSIKNAYAVVQYFSIPTIYLTVASVQMTRGHTRMGMFQDMMSVIPRTLCSLLSNVLGVAVSGLMVYEAGRLFRSYFELQTTSTTNNIGGLLLWPFALCFLLGYVLLTVAFIFGTFRSVLYRNDIVDTRSAAQKEADEALKEAEADISPVPDEEIEKGADDQ